MYHGNKSQCWSITAEKVKLTFTSKKTIENKQAPSKYLLPLNCHCIPFNYPDGRAFKQPTVRQMRKSEEQVQKRDTNNEDWEH